MRSLAVRRLSLLVCVALLGVGPVSVQCQTTDATIARQSGGPGGVSLGPGDTIAIAALGEDELSKRWTISQSGDLYLPFVGRVPAAGKTVA